MCNKDWMSYIKCKYKNLANDIFAPITEKWDRARAVKEILKKKIKIT
jgi:hypothetical protein